MGFAYSPALLLQTAGDLFKGFTNGFLVFCFVHSVDVFFCYYFEPY